jgi:tryptophan synthase alpha chain
MGRIDEIFAGLRVGGRRGLMPFVCGGYPGPGSLGAVLAEVERAGACIAEIGFPFSDPIADGPVIAAAMHEALGRGATPRVVFDEVRAARDGAGVQKLGLVGMVSVSIVWRLGVERTVELAKQAGMDGFIFPDLPADEGPELIERVKGAGLTASLLVAPTTTPQRAERIVRACSGFVYMLARAGITGESSAPPEIGERVAMLRGMTDLPIACGFGISTAEHVRAVVAHADAAIVGSALVRRMGQAHAAGEDVAAAAGAMVGELARGLR